MKFQSFSENDVIYFSEKKKKFSLAYIQIREKENRILNDTEVKMLPVPSKKNIHASEWKLRKLSTDRILGYLKQKNQELKILDIGCGNGWFSNKLASIHRSQVDGIDINITELEQAARLFKKEHLRFIYANIFEAAPAFKNKYDIITLNACVQYFNDFDALHSLLISFLKVGGEIHILDSPFYAPSKIEEAKRRTASYYLSMGASEMSTHYFHHSEEKLIQFNVMYAPKTGLFNRIFRRKDIPFPWLRYVK